MIDHREIQTNNRQTIGDKEDIIEKPTSSGTTTNKRKHKITP